MIAEFGTEKRQVRMTVAQASPMRSAPPGRQMAQVLVGLEITAGGSRLGIVHAAAPASDYHEMRNLPNWEKNYP